jgi:cell division protein FtsB
MSFLRGQSFERRGIATFVIGIVLVGGLIVVFAGSLTRSADVGAEADQTRAEIAKLDERVEAGRAEIEYLATDEYVDQVARSLGLGERGEKPFALPPDAPSPAPITPIGSQPGNATGQTPFDAWMELLFGG